MKKIFLMVIFCLPITVFANCYNISNSDGKNNCLAMQRNDSSYCYNIKNKNKKNYCMAVVKNDRSYCYNIDNSDEKNACFSNF